MKFSMCTVVVAVLVGIMPAARHAAGAVVFESSGGTAAIQITGNGFLEVGDRISLDAGVEGRELTSVVVPLNTRNHATTPAYTPALVRLTLYANDGPGGTAGTAIVSSTVAGPAFPAGGNFRTGGIDVTFPFDNFVVPDSFTFAVVNLDAEGEADFETTGADRFGVFLSQASPPAIGSSALPFVARSASGWEDLELSDPPADVNATFNVAVPEPAGLAVLGILALALRRHRRA